MVDNIFLKKLLGQSKEEYCKYLENGISDDLAEAGELLWECMKTDISQDSNLKNDNVHALKSAAAKRGKSTISSSISAIISILGILAECQTTL